MISDEFAYRQLRRLDVFYRRTMSPDALLEYVSALQRAENEDVAETVVGNFCRYGEKFPLVVELINAIADEHRLRNIQTTGTCSACRGTGRVSVTKPYNGNIPILQQMYNDTPLESTGPCPFCQQRRTAKEPISEAQRHPEQQMKLGGTAKKQNNKIASERKSLFDDDNE